MNKNDDPQSQDPPEADKPAGAGCMARLVRLSSDWRYLADLCDSEIQRTKTTPLTIIMSDDEKVRYEQAARTYRFCADALTSETNAGSPSPRHLETAPQRIQKIVKKADIFSLSFPVAENVAAISRELEDAVIYPYCDGGFPDLFVVSVHLGQSGEKLHGEAWKQGRREWLDDVEAACRNLEAWTQEHRVVPDTAEACEKFWI